MKSIKNQLIFSLLIVATLSTMIAIGVTFYEVKEELDELYDENMLQIATAISVTGISENINFSKYENKRGSLKGEEEFLVQIWHKNELTYSSLPALDLPPQEPGEARTIFHDNQKWRYYGLVQGDWLIQVSQPEAERHELVSEFYAEIITPVLIQLPIFIALIWFVVNLGFKPLKTISSLIEQRSESFLEKLPLENAPQEVSSMVEALNSLLGRLDVALKTQRRFTADAAHELRTPLTAVTLQLDILRRAISEADREDAINALYKGVERSSHLVQQLLELARQEPEASNSEFLPCDLASITNEVCTQFEPLAQNKKIDLKIVKSDTATIMGDPNALSVMIGNLVSNAILYTEENGKVHMALSKTQHGMVLSVADNGRGIPEDERRRIFDRFYRVMGTNTNGSGLGLSIVKTIAKRHHAEISMGDGLDNTGISFKLRFTL